MDPLSNSKKPIQNPSSSSSSSSSVSSSKSMIPYSSSSSASSSSSSTSLMSSASSINIGLYLLPNGSQVLVGNGTYFNQTNLYILPTDFDSSEYSSDDSFELEAVQNPYQTIIECVFILSSILALFFNISALLLMFRRQRRNSSSTSSNNSRNLRSTSPRMSTQQMTSKPAPSRNIQMSFGSSQLRIYLVNLFVNDILIALFTTPFAYTDFMYGQWIYPPLLCPITNFISTCAVSVSVYTLIAIGLERYFAIIYPFKKLAFFERYTKWIIAFIWTIGILLGIPTLVQSRAVPFHFRNRLLLDCRELWEREIGGKIYTGVLFGATFLVPFVAITFLYVSIAIKAFRHVIPGNADASRDQIQLRNKIRIIKMLVLLVITFVVCWLPIQSFNMVMWLCDRCRSSFSTPFLVQLYVTVSFICQWLSIAHSMLDPIIYCFNSRNFKLSEIGDELRTIRKLLFCGSVDGPNDVTLTTSYGEADHQRLSRASFNSSYSSARHSVVESSPSYSTVTNTAPQHQQHGLSTRLSLSRQPSKSSRLAGAQFQLRNELISEENEQANHWPGGDKRPLPIMSPTPAADVPTSVIAADNGLNRAAHQTNPVEAKSVFQVNSSTKAKANYAHQHHHHHQQQPTNTTDSNFAKQNSFISLVSCLIQRDPLTSRKSILIKSQSIQNWPDVASI